MADMLAALRDQLAAAQERERILTETVAAVVQSLAAAQRDFDWPRVQRLGLVLSLAADSARAKAVKP